MTIAIPLLQRNDFFNSDAFNQFQVGILDFAIFFWTNLFGFDASKTDIIDRFVSILEDDDDIAIICTYGFGGAWNRFGNCYRFNCRRQEQV